jgi:aminoglycoside phosphotransferase (APT) family kinase protein
MMETTNHGTGNIRAGFSIDAAALDGWLTRHVLGYQGPLGIAQFAGGQSNPTYRLTAGDRSYVLRKPPPGPLLKGAHAVDREARVLRALASASFPVPHVHAMCTDESVIGVSSGIRRCRKFPVMRALPISMR